MAETPGGVQYETPHRLVGRVAVVTGGGHGLGRAYAQRLGQEGAKVVIADLDGEAGKAIEKQLQSEGIDVLAITTDIGDENSVAEMAKNVKGHFGRADILVNNAGLMKKLEHGGFEDISLAEFERVLHVNVIGTWLCCKAIVPMMRENNYGKIINISSTRALRAPAGPGTIHYATSKSALLVFSKVLARELGKDGIRVNTVAPGGTLSDDDLTEAAVEAARTSRQATERALLMPQVAEDLVGAIAFFSSPDSDFITGQTLVVDGGTVML